MHMFFRKYRGALIGACALIRTNTVFGIHLKNLFIIYNTRAFSNSQGRPLKEKKKKKKKKKMKTQIILVPHCSLRSN